jgi:hypothetical protein
MTRRDLIKRICGALALAPLSPAELHLSRPDAATEWPLIVGVKETPWLIPINVSVGGRSEYHVVRCCPSEGWADVHVFEDGRPVVDADHKCIATMRLHGEIKLWRTA